MPHPNKRARSRMKRFLRGKGLELGALHMPLDLIGSGVEEVRYVDRMPEDKLREHYPELRDLPLVHVDVVDDAGTLTSVPDGSLDFIISNHLIVHMPDPIGSILCWHRKLKRSGVLYMAVPDKRRTFDRARPLTEIEHFLTDHFALAEERKNRDREAFYEWSRLVNKTPEDQVEAQVQQLLEMDYSIHYHTFTDKSMKALLGEIRQRFCPGLIIAAQATTSLFSNECIFVIARDCAPATHSARGRWWQRWIAQD